MYYLLLQQADEGCDYTIGCGTRIVSLETDSLEEARRKIPEKLEYYGVYGSERQLKRCDIVSFVEFFPYQQWLVDRESKQLAEKIAEQDAEARAMYEHLKERFG